MSAQHRIIHHHISRRTYALLVLCGAFAIIVAWSFASYIGRVSPLFLPTPSAVIAAGGALIGSGGLIDDIAASTMRIVIGFVFAATLAIPLGFVLGMSKHADALLGPAMSFMRYLPVSALVPLFVVWFGIGEAEKIAVIFIAVAPYLAIMTADTVRHTRKELIDAALTLGAQRQTLIWHVVVPNALPGIWDALQLLAGAAWSFVVLAEIIAATSGLGHVIIVSQRFLKTADVMAVLVIIWALGFATDLAFRISYRHLFRWTEKTRHA